MSRQTPAPILQAAAIAYRIRNGAAEFCLITTISKGNWGFPKGIIDPGETPPQTALKEAAEEAGLDGRIVGEPLGQYTYEKWGTSLRVTVFLMQVSATAESWEEMDLRERIWCGADEARERLQKNEYLQLLEVAIERIKEVDDS